MSQAANDVLGSEYDLTSHRSRAPHYYSVQSKLDIYSGAGVVKKSDVFREYLVCGPGDVDTFTCAKFVVKHGEEPEVTIPSLAGFSYTVDKAKLDNHMFDPQGRMYGLPEENFRNLTDSTGAKVAFDDAYQIYSAFFYYHDFTAYTEPNEGGPGAQSLIRVGDEVRLESSGTETKIPGWLAGKGAKWRNGETTLTFKGLATVDNKPCAVLGLVCAPSPWYMPINYMRLFGLKTYGLSNYGADLYVDVETKWVRKLDYILSEMTLVKMLGLFPVDRSYPRTVVTITQMSKDEFEQATDAS